MIKEFIEENGEIMFFIMVIGISLGVLSWIIYLKTIL
jgi:hypothetical protein